jgi:hypothetical protein
MVTTNAGSLALYDPDTGAAVPSNLTEVAAHGPGAPRAALMADWSADGATVVYASTPHPGQWIDLGDGAIAKLRYSHAGGVHSSASPSSSCAARSSCPAARTPTSSSPACPATARSWSSTAPRALAQQPRGAAGQRLFLADADGRWATDLAALNGGAGDADITCRGGRPAPATTTGWRSRASTTTATG